MLHAKVRLYHGVHMVFRGPQPDQRCAMMDAIETARFTTAVHIGFGSIVQCSGDWSKYVEVPRKRMSKKQLATSEHDWRTLEPLIRRFSFRDMIGQKSFRVGLRVSYCSLAAIASQRKDTNVRMQ